MYIKTKYKDIKKNFNFFCCIKLVFDIQKNYSYIFIKL